MMCWAGAVIGVGIRWRMPLSLPWLVGTAFIHSVMIQEKRSMLKLWNMLLVIASFSAVMFGTFATRSGVIESVHSFARSEVGFPMLAFWAAMTLGGAGDCCSGAGGAATCAMSASSPICSAVNRFSC